MLRALKGVERTVALLSSIRLIFFSKVTVFQKPSSPVLSSFRLTSQFDSRYFVFSTPRALTKSLKAITSPTTGFI